MSQLLQLAIGLQRAGVEVRIWNADLDAKRTARTNPNMPDIETEIAHFVAMGREPGCLMYG